MTPKFGILLTISCPRDVLRAIFGAQSVDRFSDIIWQCLGNGIFNSKITVNAKILCRYLTARSTVSQLSLA